MAQIIVRNLDDGLKAQLAMRAKRHGHSMEEEVRQILARSITKHRRNTGELLNSYFRNIELDTPLEILPRQEIRASDFSE